jgi:hypothetical protein
MAFSLFMPIKTLFWTGVMPFKYYERLRQKEKEIYNKSDSITSLPLFNAESLFPLVKSLEESLKNEEILSIQRYLRELAMALSERFHVSPVRIKVLEVRPSNHYGELHGLYYPKRDNFMPAIILWMKTAKKAKIIAFKTFLRTFVHEFCHHLDYEFFKLPESFHTEGFYKRESHLLHQLLNS